MFRRTRILDSIAALVLLTVALPADAQRRRIINPSPIAFNNRHSEGGYADQTSVPQGGAIRFHVATRISPFTMVIRNLADARIMHTINGLNAEPLNCSGGFRSGCGWPAVTTFNVPVTWPSGYYSASFPTSFGTRYAIFVVRPSRPGSTSKTLIVSPTNTYQAFNSFGGASLNPSTSPNRATSLSFDRPYDHDAGLGRYQSWEQKFVQWMTSTGRSFEVVTDQDLHDPTLLANYNVVVLVGHSAYWTDAARQNLETFNRNGGHIAIFGGNTMWFRVGLADNGRTLVGQENATSEISTEPTGIVTTNWYRHPVNQPENRIIATSFRNGGHSNRLNVPDRYEMIPIPQRIPWVVTDPSHWVFSGTGLTRGATFGQETTGLEVDGVIFNCDSSGLIGRPDGSDEAPLNYQILAVTPASLGWGTMGYYVNPAGGAVFNAASQGWVWGLEFNDTIKRITGNVVDHFASGARLLYNPVQTSIVSEDRFNCPPTFIPLPGWRSNTARGNVTAGCAYEGPGGLELSGPNQIALARSIAPAGSARDRVDLRFYVKADDFQRRTETPHPIITLQNRTDGSTSRVAHIEIDVSGSTRRIRLARRNPDGGFVAGSGWIDLANGWHLVEATWRSPGTMSLQVDGGAALTLENPNTGQTANEMIIEFPSGQVSQGGRLCIDAIAAGTEKPGRVAQLK